MIILLIQLLGIFKHITTYIQIYIYILEILLPKTKKTKAKKLNINSNLNQTKAMGEMIGQIKKHNTKRDQPKAKLQGKNKNKN